MANLFFLADVLSFLKIGCFFYRIKIGVVKPGAGHASFSTYFLKSAVKTFSSLNFTT